ncbi:MAG: UvrD-helicase domain-containing protein [Puniceicoccales bacterium]|jgi:ATP-dependent exoDNAse (exonuclease V) beta subunit|nr:UvrD-helicase domain-containing protein [Puniceicoccales bacterium]
MELPDQMQRNTFTEELEKNFSVIASAGAGKTTAIAERIANFILRDAQMQSDDNSLAKKFLAVTYTEKAAMEIRDRVFSKIFGKTEHSPQLRWTCVRRMKFAFFGTIHAFASKFLRAHCALLGLRNDFEIAKNEETLWQEFISGFGDVLGVIPNELRDDFLCTHDANELLKHAKNYNPEMAVDIGKMPPINLENILAHRPRNSESRTKYFLQLLEEWDFFRRRREYFPMPDCLGICNSRPFIELCQSELNFFLRWKENSENFFLGRIARAYREFRIKSGKLICDDLINLSVALLPKQIVVAEIERSPHRVILDEAQDTDPQQFRLLLGVCQKILRNGISMDTGGNFPGNGYFSMVGDPQQSIYCDRASVKIYSKLHDSFVQTGAANSLTFSVTMRCPKAVVNFANEKFSNISLGVDFIRLVAKPNSFPGEVDILKLKSQKGDKIRCSASQTAEFFRGKTLSDFGVDKWADIAILAPRKDWLLDIYKYFSTGKQLPEAQLHFESANEIDASPIRWLSSCLRYINNSADQREFAGILREIFGIKSQEIINHFRYAGSPLCASIDAMFTEVRRGRNTLPLAKFLLGILDRFKIFQRIEALHIYSGENFSALLKQTIELCYFAEASGMHTVEAENFLTEKISTQKKSENINASAVQFITFHKSKGLEWPIVLLPFLYRRRQLHGNASPKSPAAEEKFGELLSNECRLLYVACTRARRKLLLLDDHEVFRKNLTSNAISSGEILFESTLHAGAEETSPAG